MFVEGGRAPAIGATVTAAVTALVVCIERITPSRTCTLGVHAVGGTEARRRVVCGADYQLTFDFKPRAIDAPAGGRIEKLV